MVRQLALRVGRQLGLDARARALLDVSVRTRDVGMVALPDAVVLTTAPLSPLDWEVVNRHPVLGAEMLEGIPVAAAAAPVVRCHHERWDGAGYPDGIRGDSIPLLSRVIATCDAFVAMASDRPHRRGIGAEAALEQVCQEGGSQLDPRIVDALVAALADRNGGSTTARGAKRQGAGDRVRPARQPLPGGRWDLTSAIAQFEVVPAFAPAYERVLAATAKGGTTGGELVAAIESDTGLTVAVLRRAQGLAGGRPIANVSDAVAALSVDAIEEAIRPLPLAEFPWRTSRLEVLMHHFRVHAQAVTRAADRIAREVRQADRDDVLAGALLHDIGKLVLGSANVGYPDAMDAKTTTPEERTRHEQRTFGLDHASLGALLLRRWGLPDRLASTVAAHHSSEENQTATYVRLADMLAHHAQGDRVDRRKMLDVAVVCGLPAKGLRDVLFDLPHSGGSQRRRAEPSPLSDRETDALRLLAQGKPYKVIASELGVAVSTVRSHLHNAYEKLAVADRAQAVLRATDMGWL
jgi:putative nucleotidyltransferase with HDIG domain